MTKKERFARQALVVETMSKMNVSKDKAKSIIAELEQYGLLKFLPSGEVGLKKIG